VDLKQNKTKQKQKKLWSAKWGRGHGML